MNLSSVAAAELDRDGSLAVEARVRRGDSGATRPLHAAGLAAPNVLVYL